MELYKMLYNRLTTSAELLSQLSTYNGRPAVFYQVPPTNTDALWDAAQYPRIDYIVDMQENPARNSSGLLVFNVWCDARQPVQPESIERILRSLFHAVFVQAGDETYCFAWAKSDAFEAKLVEEKNVHTIGVTVFFDVVACPPQYTMSPDPIRAMNLWTKSILPDAIVIGEDSFDGWLSPTLNQPVVYWRLTSQGNRRKHLAYTWLDVGISGHVYAPTANDRLATLAIINTAHSLADHIPMEDGSPLFLRDFSFTSHQKYILQGQITAKGNFGLLQPWYASPSAKSHPDIQIKE